MAMAQASPVKFANVRGLRMQDWNQHKSTKHPGQIIAFCGLKASEGEHAKATGTYNIAH